MMWTPSNFFNGGTFAASAIHEDASGNFFTIDEEDGSTSTVFGTQNGLWAVDNRNGALLGLPKASTKDFNPASAGIYNSIYYTKQNAQMQGQGMSNYEVGNPGEGKATISVSAAGMINIIDSQNNIMASGTLVPVANVPYLYDGTPNTLTDPCYGMFNPHGHFDLASGRIRNVPGQRCHLFQLLDSPARSEQRYLYVLLRRWVEVTDRTSDLGPLTMDLITGTGG